MSKSISMETTNNPEDQRSLGEKLTVGSPEDRIINRIDTEREVESLLSTLPRRDAEILLRRANGETLRELARVFGVSYQRISQCELKSIKKLKARGRRNK